jgi:hypothetical protein
MFIELARKKSFLFSWAASEVTACQWNGNGARWRLAKSEKAARQFGRASLPREIKPVTVSGT